MADSRIRHLERLAARGDQQAEAQLLLARVRLGSLAPERLRLAAYLGHPAARRALDSVADDHADLERWLEGLVATWGLDLALRASYAAARSVAPLFEARHPEEDCVARALEAAERQLGGTAAEEDVVRGALHDLAAAARASEHHRARQAAWAAHGVAEATCLHSPAESRVRRAAAAVFAAGLAATVPSLVRQSIREALLPQVLEPPGRD